MKKLLITTLCICTYLLAHTQSITTNASLQSVTVYSAAAELNHTAKVNIPSGSSEVIIKNVSNAIDENSIQIGSSTDLTIMSVSFVREFLTDVVKAPNYKRIQDSLKASQKEMEIIKSQIATQRNAISILDANKVVRGENTGLNVAELQKMVDYYIAKHKEISITAQELSTKETKLQEIINKLTQQMAELNASQESGKGEIRLQVISNTAANTTLNISYITYTAAWSPTYDLKAKDTKSPLKLIYKANIVQHTGLDWNKVKLSVSTSNPSITSTAPILSAWFLDYYAPNYGYKGKASMDKTVVLSNTMLNYGAAPVAKNEADGEEESASVNDFTNVSEAGINAVFDIDLAYDIPSDNKSHVVSMKEYEINASYKYYCVPKLDPDVFLLAEVADWEQLNLVPGPANIIFDGNFVGKSYIDPTSTQDTLNLSLGRDKKIIVKRERVQDLCSKKVIGSSREHLVTTELKVKNTRKDAIQIILKDQIPISVQKDMTVDVLENSNAMQNNETGVLTWKMEVPSNQTEKKRVSYKVKYPKDKLLPALQ
jgi:uncharacterized protein (TIGR02231 family)